METEADMQPSVQAVTKGFLITGLVKDADDPPEEWMDTWVLDTTGGTYSYEKAKKYFSPAKGSVYLSGMVGNDIYVTAYVPQKEMFVLKKIKGLKAYPDGVGENGWQTIDGKIYYYENGKPLTGFRTIDKVTYYFYEGDSLAECDATQKGEMVTGWMTLKKSGRIFYLWDGNKKISCNGKKKGAMCTSWVTFENGARFFFNNGNKKVKSNTAQRGQMATGWLTGTEGRTYYLWTGNKKIKTNARKTGQMATGWVTFADGSKSFLWNCDKNLKSAAVKLGERIEGHLYDKKADKYYDFNKNGKLVKTY